MLLEVSDLSVSYGRVEAVRNLSFTVGEGEVVALVGTNGAGKSTTVTTIAGALRPTGGTITFAGESIAGLRPEDIVRRGVSLVPEDRRTFERLTVAENLELGRTPKRRTSSPDAVERSYELFPVLRELRKNAAGKLSGGQQQQLVIARALLAEPRLLMLDEPSLGLAPQMVDMVYDKLALLKAEGVTILLIEQNASRALEIADRLHVLAGGSIRMSAEASMLRDDAGLRDQYFDSSSGLAA